MLNIRTQRGKQLALLAVLFSLMLFAGTSAVAQAPAANTSIGNQASATYTDGSLVVRTATSNAVFTIVQQVDALTLTSSSAKTASAGAQVVYPHILTNMGNGPDSFTMALTASGTAANTNLAIYMDANNDGIADNNVNLMGAGTISLASGASVHLLVTGTVPVTATPASTDTMTVTATSTLSGGNNSTANNVDTTTITGNAVINVTKSLSATSGAAGSGPLTVTLTYTNNGNATATAVKLGDILPAGMTYVAGSGRWSVTGATALTDLSDGVQGTSPTIDYSLSGSTITAIINSVPTGVSGALTFQVNIASPLAPGPINNTATINYNDGAANVGPFNTNVATFTVTQTAAVSITTPTAIASTTQGATVSFTNTVKNLGNGSDTFNITLAPGATYPAGTTFALYKSDGVTPLLGSNVGPLASNASYDVTVKATLPPNATGGGPYSVTVTATSSFLGTVFASASDVLTTITASTVDITDNAPNGGTALGVGTGVGQAGPSVTATVAPGASTIFTMYVSNTSTVADTYNLVASTSIAFGPGNILPAGWSLTFTKGTGAPCTAANLGSTINNTGLVNAGANTLVCAVVTIPASGTGSTPVIAQPIYFQSVSPTTTAADYIFNAVTVSTVHNVTFIPNNSGQVYPGGVVVYNHTIKNNGNVTESITFTGSFVSDSQSGWASILFQDANLNGSLDALDTAVTTVTTLSLAPGATSVVLFNKVAAPSAAPIGAVDVTTLTATYSGFTAVATDTSTVIAGDLRLSKMQAYDATCVGTAGTYTASALSSKSGTCLFYQITATNQGTAAVNTVVVSDATPAYTTYLGSKSAPTCTGVVGPATCTLVLPSDGATGTVTANISTLAPAASAVITFEVKIN